MAQQSPSSMTIAEEFTAKIRQDNQKEKIMRFAPILVLFVLVAVFTIVCGTSFFSLNNAVSILNQLAIPLVVAVGLTFVIVIGGIDLSINGTVGMAASLLGVFVLNTRTGLDLGFLGIILAVAASVGIGVVIGLIHVYLKVPSFMVSFAFMYICMGIGLLSYGGKPPTVMDPVLAAIPKMSFIGVPIITWIAIAVLLFAIFIQEYTAFGRYIFAVGTDETILHAVGVSVNRVKVMVFTLAGFCFGVAGVLGCIRLGQGQIGAGDGLMFPAQAAVVIGGTALSGGKGGVINTIIGVLLMTVLINGLTLMGVNPYIKNGIQGVIILVVVAMTVARGAKVISK